MKVGIIGSGNIGSAIAYGIIKNDKELIISNRSKDKLEKFKEFSNVEIASSNKELVEKSKYIILAVGANMYEEVINEIKDYVSSDKVIIGITVGFSLERFAKLLPDKKVVVAMTNTPAMVFEAMSVICPNDKLSEKEINEVLEIFGLFGKVKSYNEEDFSVFTAACGCLPAFVYIFIEAAADGAVLNGMKRSDAYNFIGQSILGSAKLLLESKEHPAKLKDMVTSPGGTTIRGVKVLEEEGFRSAIIKAIDETSKN